MILGFPEYNLILFSECGALETLLVRAISFLLLTIIVPLSSSHLCFLRAVLMILCSFFSLPNEPQVLQVNNI